MIRRILVELRNRAPLTLTGLIVVGAAIGAWAWGRGPGDLVLTAMGIAVTAFVALTLVAMAVATGYLWWRIRAAGPHAELVADAEVGRPFATGFAYPRLRFWPLMDVVVEWARPHAVEVVGQDAPGVVREIVTPRDRGRFRAITRRFRVRDILGLTSFTFTTTTPATLRFLPESLAQDVLAAFQDRTGDLHSHPAGEPAGDLVETRQYGPGDPLRIVLWKAFARTRRLLVRMPERAFSPSENVVAFMVAGRGDQATASLARALIELPTRERSFLFSADGAERPASDPDDALDLLIDSAGFRDSGGQGLHALAAQLGPASMRGCFLFVPSSAGPWLDPVLAFAGRPDVAPTIVMGVEGRVEPSHAGTVRRWLTRTERPSVALGPLLELHDRFEALRLKILMIHAPSGLPMDVQALRTLVSR